jgi:hypothetical protein
MPSENLQNMNTFNLFFALKYLPMLVLIIKTLSTVLLPLINPAWIHVNQLWYNSQSHTLQASIPEQGSNYAFFGTQGK